MRALRRGAQRGKQVDNGHECSFDAIGPFDFRYFCSGKFLGGSLISMAPFITIRPRRIRDSRKNAHETSVVKLYRD